MQQRRIALVAIALAVAASSALTLSTNSAPAAQTPAPTIAHPPPTLASADLPPGFRELASSIPLEGVPAESRIWTRTEPGPGPSSITNVTLVRPGPTPEEYMARLRREFAAQGAASPTDQGAVLSDCVELDSVGIGDEALFYKCRSDWLEGVIPPGGGPAEGEMATIIFRRGYLVSQISVTRADGPADEDVRRYAGLLDPRLATYLASPPPA
jgi:hypothetical protein